MKAGNTWNGRRRPAVSMLELLVVVGIVGTLAGLLLPAVAAAREAAARLRCAHRLRQLGLAAAQFEDSRGAFPGTDWPQTLRPLLELATYEEGEPIRLYQCPSRSGTAARQRDYGGGSQPDAALFAGRRSAITDGASHTLHLADRCARADGTFPPSVPAQVWFNYDPGEETLGNTAARDGTVRDPADPNAGGLGFGARHPGAMNVLMCDGSVQRFRYGVRGLRSLVGCRDGDVVAWGD